MFFFCAANVHSSWVLCPYKYKAYKEKWDTIKAINKHHEVVMIFFSFLWKISSNFFFFFPQISYHWLNMEAHCTHTWTLFQRSGSHFFNLMSQFPENTQLCVTETLTCVKCNKIGLRDGRKDTNVYITITTWWQRT